jgi:putative membrane protein
VETPGATPKSEANELAERRTEMAFQRTRMAAERTLMAVVRTALSLIGFGFTIYKVFEKLRDAKIVTHAESPKRFGLSLVLLGLVMLGIGIAYHIAFMLDLRRERKQLNAAGLVLAPKRFPVSLTLIVALVLLAIGIFTGISLMFGWGPFGD